MTFKKVNNITGWLAFAIAYITYLLTMEATASLWDCGEFLSTAYKLEVGHSPGAPLFMMLGRLFGILAPSADKVALFINSMSALASAFTILFLFWTITHFARKIADIDEGESGTGKLIAIMGAGFVGALAYTFSDTFWFSAVEAEVYAMSSFFTAIVFWAILKWEHASDHPHADRWLVLIFYLMGLSIGVHLLNLLTIPAIIMVYYFKRYQVTLTGGLIAFVIGCGILGFVQFGIIQYLPIFASKFELLFVNSFGLPLNTGAVFFMILVCGLLAWLIIWAKKKGQYLLHLGALCTVFVIIGYSSYISIILRSKADVPIDMGNPDNVMTLIPYLQRDQYGSQPIITGPDFTSRVIGIEDGRAIYAAVKKDGKDYYELVDHKPIYKYDQVRFFPRIHDFNDANHIRFYRSWLGLSEIDEPTGIDNIKFFWGYQMNWMYWRYLMWNYAGRQNDLQGQGEAHSGNWISGIKPLDKLMGKGDTDALPEAVRNSKARNQLYLLPFLLGIAGLVYQYKKDRHDTVIVALLFFFTGAAIVLYLNNTPMQPRERDYAYAGSTYAFAIWIGLGVLMVSHWFKRFLKGSTAPAAATAICLLAVPILMAAVEWDDHDRSEKTIARDHAYNMLSSCDSNAILLTYGDNDTYPLWYLQEIEGYRTDVRIINFNLLGTDWQNEQLNFKVNDADALPVIWKPEHYRGGSLNFVSYAPDPRIPQDRYFSLEEVINFITSPDHVTVRGGDKISYLPTKNLYIPIDREVVLKSGIVKAADSAMIPAQIRFQLKSNTVIRAELALMNIIAGQAKTGWTRPIYMTAGTPNLGLDQYFKAEGTLRKLVPAEVPTLLRGGISSFYNMDKNVELYNRKFTYGGADKNKIYYDEKNRLIFLTYRQHTAELATNLVLAGRKADAIKILDRFMNSVSESSLSYDIQLYDRSILAVIEAYYLAGAPEKAKKYASKLVININDEVKYYNTLRENSKGGVNYLLVQQNAATLNALVNIAAQYGDAASAQKWKQNLEAISPSIMGQNPDL